MFNIQTIALHEEEKNRMKCKCIPISELWYTFICPQLWSWSCLFMITAETILILPVWPPPCAGSMYSGTIPELETPAHTSVPVLTNVTSPTGQVHHVAVPIAGGTLAFPDTEQVDWLQKIRGLSNTRKFSPSTGGFFSAPADGCNLRLDEKGPSGDFGGRRNRRTDNGFKGFIYLITQPPTENIQTVRNRC